MLEEFLLIIVFIVLVSVVIPYIFHRHPNLFYATENHIITAKDLVRFISDCTWIELNKVHYDLNQLCIIEIDKEDHNFCVIKSLDNVFFNISIDTNGISINCTIDDQGYYIFQYQYKSLNGEFNFTDNPNFIYLQNLCEQMVYAEAVCHRYNV